MANPMYRQIAEDLRAQIESGDLQPGQQLRTELELREHYGASRNTVRDAIKWLTTLGLVETHPGQGTFVSRDRPVRHHPVRHPRTGLGSERRLPTVGGEQAEQEPRPARSRSRSSKPRRVCRHAWDQRAPKSSAAMSGASLTTLHGLCRPPITRWSSPTAERSGSGARNIEEGTVSTWRIHSASARWLSRQDHRARADYRSGLFQAASGRPGPDVRDYQDGFDGNGKPMRFTVTVYPADRNQFIVNVGEVPQPTAGGA